MKFESHILISVILRINILIFFIVNYHFYLFGGVLEYLTSSPAIHRR
jgi:hypothetical protein